MKVRVFLAVPLAALMIACGRNNVAPAGDLLTPVAPSAAISTTNALGTPGREDVVVNIQDACDPDTFNQATGNANTCVRAGGVTFDQFVAELTRLGFIEPWHFAAPTANVRVGRRLKPSTEAARFTPSPRWPSSAAASIHSSTTSPAFLTWLQSAVWTCSKPMTSWRQVEPTARRSTIPAT